MQTRSNKPMTLGSVSLGARFVFRTAEIFGDDFANARKPPFEGQVLTVVAFKPRYVNQIVAQDQYGHVILLRLSDVEKCLNLLPAPENLTQKEQSVHLEGALEFVRQADGPTLNALIREIKENRRGRDVNAAAQLNVSDVVIFDPPGSCKSLQGAITKINAGRVTIAVVLEQACTPTHISVPASMVRRCSQEKEHVPVPTHVA